MEIKMEDLNDLKETLKDSRWEIHTDHPFDPDKFFVVKKKDPWEGGVEFCTDEIKIYKVQKITNNWVYYNSLIDGSGERAGKSFLKPSTESAYIEQLKKIAYEKFGEIKEGDKFINPNGGKDTRCKEAGWAYRKEFDWLYYGTCMLYKQGKWATKLPEMVKVRLNSLTLAEKSVFLFDITNFKQVSPKKCHQWGEFLASELEQLLNNEHEK